MLLESNNGISSDTSAHTFVSATTNGITRIGNVAAEREASGQVLTVGGSPLLPRWEKNNVTSTVYYVAQGGSDTNSRDQIGRAFATIRHACDTVSALTGSDAPSLTNPISI